jgi:hypothetical protein
MKTKIVSFLVLFVFAISTVAQTMPKDADPKTWSQALKIHKKVVIADGHIDVPSPMFDEDFDLGTNSLGKFHKVLPPSFSRFSSRRATPPVGAGLRFDRRHLPRSRKISESINLLHDCI